MPSQGSKKAAGRYRLYCNLGYNLNEEAVKNYFQQFCTQGRILDVYIPRHSSGRNKGYGFTTFQVEGDLENALQQTEHLVDGTVVKVNRAGLRPEYSTPTEDSASGSGIDGPASHSGSASYGKGPRLYVGGIPDSITEQQVVAHFQKCGEVLDIYFPGKRGQKRVNYCFVTFKDWVAAERACKETAFNIAGQAIKSISVAEERTILPPQPLADHGMGSIPDGHSFGYGMNPHSIDLQNSPLAALQQQIASQGLDDALQNNQALAMHWQQYLVAGPQYQNLYNPGPRAGGGPLGDEALLSLQQQYSRQQQHRQESLLHQHQRQLDHTLPSLGNSNVSPGIMHELQTGIHDLRIPLSADLDLGGYGVQQFPQQTDRSSFQAETDTAFWKLPGIPLPNSRPIQETNIPSREQQLALPVLPALQGATATSSGLPSSDAWLQSTPSVRDGRERNDQGSSDKLKARPSSDLRSV